MDLCCVLKLQPLFIFFAQQRSRPLEFNLTSLLIMSASCTEISQVGALATCCHCLGVNETSRSLVSGHVALFPSSIWLLASLMFIVGMFFIIIIVRVRIPLAVPVLGWEDSGIGISGNGFDFLGCSIRILTQILGVFCLRFIDVRVLLWAAKTSAGTPSQRAGAETPQSQVQERWVSKSESNRASVSVTFTSSGQFTVDGWSEVSLTPEGGI